MRYQADHKEKTRALILGEASRAIRRDGAHSVSLASVMKGVGLTHGGFYSHFSSRDEMLAAAITQTFGDTRDRWAHETLDRSAKDGLVRYIDWYLSKAHRDHRETGCAIAAIGGELSQLAPDCQRAFSEGCRNVAALLSEHIARLPRDNADELAQSMMSELVGALVLARIESNPRRSDTILETSLRSIKSQLGVR
ncbi:MAG TPA: TetR/AcrR family transcriptional regulator [Kofleriaceae bacterium]